MNEHYLSVDNLSFEYPDGYRALSGVNLNLSKGERLGVLGPNGAGKTTLILHLNGILGELKGDIKLNEISFTDNFIYLMNIIGNKSIKSHTFFSPVFFSFYLFFLEVHHPLCL